LQNQTLQQQLFEYARNLEANQKRVQELEYQLNLARQAPSPIVQTHAPAPIVVSQPPTPLETSKTKDIFEDLDLDVQGSKRSKEEVQEEDVLDDEQILRRAAKDVIANIPPTSNASKLTEVLKKQLKGTEMIKEALLPEGGYDLLSEVDKKKILEIKVLEGNPATVDKAQKMAAKLIEKVLSKEKKGEEKSSKKSRTPSEKEKLEEQYQKIQALANKGV
jgi:hypothetical protein